MPSPRHDTLVKLFADRPQLVTKILRDLLGADLPDTPLIRRENASFNTRNSVDIASDLIFTMGAPQSAAHAVIVEMQQGQAKDPQQLARYAAALWLQLRCDVTVLMICPDRAAAEHYAKPIESGLSGYCFRAQVLGPDSVPFISDPQDVVADPGLAALSLLMHGRDGFHRPSREEPPERGFITSTGWPVFTPWAREHYGRGHQEGMAEGKAEEAAKSVLLVLEARGVGVTDEDRARIESCGDVGQLEVWLTRAATAETVGELFEPGGQR